MNVNIDYTKLMNEKFNNMLLNMKSDNAKTNHISKTMVQFANKYGLFGTDAMNFILDLVNTLMSLSTDISKEDK